MQSRPRILAIRGGAIGDFILTLPALRLIRDNFANCDVEILGYPHIAAIAQSCGPEASRTYADAVHSIEYGPLAGFFARGGSLAPQMGEFFAGYQQVVSWLFDPDGIFEANLRRAGVKHYLSAYTKITDDAHAASQLARGLESLALYLDTPPAARLVPSPNLQREADAWLAQHGMDSHFVAFHPGSGSPRKNWPLANWQALAERIQRGKLLVISGEADEHARGAFPNHPLAHGLPLPLLSAILARASAYFGHDTGISHLAAASGTQCTLLLGPTAASVWAPLGENVSVIEAPAGDLGSLPVDSIQLPC